MNIDDKDQLDVEIQYNQSQGVDIDEERQQIKNATRKLKTHKLKGIKDQKYLNYYIIVFTLMMPTNCIILQYFWLHDLMENEFEKLFSLTFMFLNYIMCWITYYQCVTIKNIPIKKPPPVITEQQADSKIKLDKICEICDSWKPIRTSHCSMCGTCVMKMDHHCPWVVNCVGYANHRSFLLFNIYMFMGAAQYCFRTVIYFFFLYNSGQFWQESIFFYLFWFFTNTVLIPITMMLCGLTIFHSMMASSNFTTLQSLKGQMMNCVCVPEYDPENPQPYHHVNSEPNIFNKGFYGNISEFFSNDRFFFWFPRENINSHDGTNFEMIPQVSHTEMVKLDIGERYPQENKLNIEKILENYEEEIINSKEKYENRKCQFGVKEFELVYEFQIQIKSQQKFEQYYQKQEQESTQRTNSLEEDSQEQFI